MCELHTTTKHKPVTLPFAPEAPTHPTMHSATAYSKPTPGTPPKPSPAPEPTLTEANWRTFLEAEANKLGIDPEDLKALLQAKGLDNPQTPPKLKLVADTKDGSGCKLYGPLGVHSGLLNKGKWANTPHGLKHKNGQAMTAEELTSNPSLATQAGLMHFKNLLDTHKGNTQKAVNHFMTGSPLGKKLNPASCVCCGDATTKAANPETLATIKNKPLLPALPPEDSDHTHGDHSASPPALSTPSSPPTHDAGDTHDAHGTPTASPSPLTTPPSLPTHDAGDTHDAHSGHAPTTALAGDIPAYEEHASGHIGHGHGNLINAPLHNSALTKVFGNKIDIPSIVARNNQLGAYNPGQPDDKKQAGAYLVANALLKLTLAPIQGKLSESQLPALSKQTGIDVGTLKTLKPEMLNGLIYGTFKNLALKNDAQSIRDFTAAMGLNTEATSKLTDKELLNIWAVNEHNNLHGILFGNSAIYNVIHMTSLNDKDSHTQIPSLRGKLGGFNDKGDYPQWGWLEDAQSFMTKYLA